MLTQALLLIVLLVICVCKIGYLTNMNNAHSAQERNKVKNMKKSSRKQFVVASILDTAHGLGVSYLSGALA